MVMRRRIRPGCRWWVGVWTIQLLMAQSAQAAPGAAQAAIRETMAYMDAGQLEPALASAKKAIQAEPERVEAHLLYIRLMGELGRTAVVQGEYATRRDTRKDALSLMLYGRTLEKPEQMEATFRQALTKDPKLGWAHYCLATVHVQRNQIDKAVASLEDAIKVQPGFYQAMESLATLYLGMGKSDRAIPLYQKALELDADNPQVMYELGSLLAKKGDNARAASLLEGSLKRVPNNTQVMSNLGFVYLKLKRYDDSIALYDRVLQASPNDSAARLNREVVRRVKKRGRQV